MYFLACDSPFCVNHLTVAEGKKLRLVIDLRLVNEFLVNSKLKYENLRSLSQLIDEDYWSFFFGFEIRVPSGGHLRTPSAVLTVSWVFGNSERLYFAFFVSPLGFSSARFCFTKLMRPQVKRWRPRAYLSFIYLDDGLGGQPEKVSAAASII